MARSFIIEQQKELIKSNIPIFDNLCIVIDVEGVNLIPSLTYNEKDKLPFILSVNGPVSLRGVTEPYSVSTTKDE